MWWFVGILIGLLGAVLSIFGTLNNRKAGGTSGKWYVVSLGGGVTAAVILFVLFTLALLV